MTDLLLRPLRATALYNPHLLDRRELVELFTARNALLDQLLRAIAETGRGKVPQHHLIVGQRGMGKTMLLRRLRFELEDRPDLARTWLPLSFPEEQYNVGRLSDFWINCLEALAESLEEQKQLDEASTLDQVLEDLRPAAEQERTAEALAILLATAKRLKRRLVLLVDNVDLVFERIAHDGWKLREVLAHEPALLLIGASTRFMEETYDYDQPFYDFFAIHELRGLTAHEARELLRHYAAVWKSEAVARVVAEDPARIDTLHTLSGGNPRTLALLYTILSRGVDGDARSDLEGLLDHCTPLYKARLEALAPQAQQVLHGLAVHWDPWSAGELAAELRLDVNVVSSHLNRLAQQGVVEKVPYEPATKTGFQVAERFFNIWYLMRMTRRARRKLIWLVEFLRLFYSKDDLRDLALRLLHSFGTAEQGRQRVIELSFALAGAIADSGLKGALELFGLRTIFEDEAHRGRLREVLDLEGEDAHLEPRLRHQQRLAELKERVLSLDIPDASWSAERFWRKLEVSVIDLRGKAKLIEVLSSATPKPCEILERALETENHLLATAVGSEALRDLLHRAIRDGYMMDLGDVEGASAAAAALGDESLVSLALAQRVLFSVPAEDLKSAVSRLEEIPPEVRPALVRAAIEAAEERSAGRYLDPWLEFAVRSEVEPREDREVARAVSALELWYSYWFVEGVLEDFRLAHTTSRDAKVLHAVGSTQTALFALRSLVSQLSKNAVAVALAEWFFVAVRLFPAEAARQQAENAFRAALTLEPERPEPWEGLGRLFRVPPQRDSEAELALRRREELQPASAANKMVLAEVLLEQQRDLLYAAELVRTAIRLVEGSGSDANTSPDQERLLVARLLLARIHVAQDGWSEAASLVASIFRSEAERGRGLLGEPVREFLADAISAGRAREIAALLDDLDLADRFRPLREALEAIAQGKRTYLRRVAPEVRGPAEEILERLVGESWPGGQEVSKRSPGARRSPARRKRLA